MPITGGMQGRPTWLLQRQTTDANALRLTFDGAAANAGNVPLVPAAGTLTCALRISATQIGGAGGAVNNGAVWFLPLVRLRRAALASSTLLVTAEQFTQRGVYTGQPRAAGLASMVPNSATTSGGTVLAGSGQGGDVWRALISADTTIGALNITCTGAADQVIAWEALMLLLD